MAVSYYHSPIGILKITSDGSFLTGVRAAEKAEKDDHDVITEMAVDQLEEFFHGNRKDFSVPLLVTGTDFQKKVYETLMKIPYGKTVSYKELGIMMGISKGHQAIGSALHVNPILIIIPCHRVIKANGSCGGYALGIEAKQYLLQLENRLCEKNL